MNARPQVSAILVDGSNVYATAKALGFSVDYKKLIDTFEGNVLKAFYFTALRAANEESAVRPMVDYLEYNGWTCITKPTQEWMQADGKPKIKGNMDIEIAVIAKEIAPYITDLYLFSGDGDFSFLVDALQRTHVIKVHVVSSIKTNPPFCADRLRRQADSFIDLADMRNMIERIETPADKVAREARSISRRRGF